MKVLGALLLTATMLVLAVDAVPRPHRHREGHHWARNCSMDGSWSQVRDTGIKLIKAITEELCDGDADKACNDKILLCLPEVRKQRLHELVNARDTLVANFTSCAEENDVTISDPELLDRLSNGECDPTKSEDTDESDEGSEESRCHRLHHGYKCIMDNLGISDDQVVQMAICFMKKLDLMSVLLDCMNKNE
ncbi:uncharacterized protein [Panulirus ornatus]